jgi:hypothetical protein
LRERERQRKEEGRRGRKEGDCGQQSKVMIVVGKGRGNPRHARKASTDIWVGVLV